MPTMHPLKTQKELDLAQALAATEAHPEYKATSKAE